MSDDQPPTPPFGGFQFMFGPPPDEEHQRLAITAIDVMRKALEEMCRIYDEQAAVAATWNEQLGRDDVSVETCLAGQIRNNTAGRTAARIGKSMSKFDPFLAHEYRAKAREHQAAFERWQGILGRITNLEHTHTPDAPHRDDTDGPTPLPEWLK